MLKVENRKGVKLESLDWIWVRITGPALWKHLMQQKAD